MQLQAVRVVDLTRILSGPFCSLLLADMGAEVIKVEPPGGDPLREQGAMVEGLSWYFAAFNRNKRSVVLNLRRASGRAALRRLIATADVVVENFRPGVMADLGLDWSQLSSLRPGIIHTSVTGFGARGPYADRPAFDFIAQAMSGFMSGNGTPETGCSPHRMARSRSHRVTTACMPNSSQRWISKLSANMPIFAQMTSGCSTVVRSMRFSMRASPRLLKPTGLST
jgi:crotonobetainyl-CoA:carnitine CoA-transferase CaiB-like acyl-CoA transferase